MASSTVSHQSYVDSGEDLPTVLLSSARSNRSYPPMKWDTAVRIPAILLCILWTIYPRTAESQRIQSMRGSMEGTSVTEAPVIDGRLDESAWQKADGQSGFRQLTPREGAPASQKTEVYVLHGAENLYVAARLHDEEPSKIRERLTRRDNLNKADWFLVSFDSNLDRETAYTFGVSAGGVQYDALRTPNNRNRSWDAVWESAVQRTDRGWTVELSVPYSMLRFPEQATQTWGVHFTRRIPRLGERSEWPLIPRSERSNRVSNYGRITGITGIEPRPNLQIRPYSLARATAEEDPQNPGSATMSRSVDVGGNLKVGLGPNVTLDVAVNPDFGQVESDPAVLNLTAFETFFDERRPFFVEGQQYYQFDVSGGDLFYSRRIGSKNPIIGASKFSGRTNNGLSFGVLGATTGGSFSPSRGYGVARLNQQFDRYSSVGGMLTAFDGPRAANEGRERSVGAGGDWDLRFRNNMYAFRGYSALTHQRWTRGGKDPTTGFSGQMEVEKQEGIFQVKANAKVTEKEFDPNNVGQLTRDRTDFAEFFATYDYDVNGGNPFGPFRRATLGGSVAQTYSVEDRLSRRQFIIFKSKFRTKGFQDISISGRLFNFLDSYDLFETRGLWPRNRKYHLRTNVGGSTADTRDWILRTNGDYTIRGSEGNEYAVSIGADWDATERLALSGTLQGEWERSVLAWSSNEAFKATEEGFKIGTEASPPTELGASDYTGFGGSGALDRILDSVPLRSDNAYYVPVYGERDTRSLDLTLRSTVAFTPRLSVQVYSQFFLAQGEYDNFKVLTDKDHIAPFPSYPKESQFLFDNFQSNVVFRWRFHPGSTLYFVWDHTRNERREFNNLEDKRAAGTRTNFGDRLTSPFNVFPRNSFIFKIEYNLGYEDLI